MYALCFSHDESRLWDGLDTILKTSAILQRQTRYSNTTFLMGQIIVKEIIKCLNILFPAVLIASKGVFQYFWHQHNLGQFGKR